MATGGRFASIDSAVKRFGFSVRSRRGEAMPGMFLALSSVVAVVALIVAALSATQRRKFKAELEKASVELASARQERQDAAGELARQRAAQSRLDQEVAEGRVAAENLAAL